MNIYGSYFDNRTYLSSEADSALLHVLHRSVSAGPHDLGKNVIFYLHIYLTKIQNINHTCSPGLGLAIPGTVHFFPSFYCTYVVNFCCYQVGCTGTSGCGGRPPWSPGALQTHIMRETTKSPRKSRTHSNPTTKLSPISSGTCTEVQRYVSG